VGVEREEALFASGVSKLKEGDVRRKF